MFRVRGHLPQTFLVIVASLTLVAVGQADAVRISINPPSSKWTPITVEVGRIIQCTVRDSPYKSLKWYINDWDVVSDHSALVVTEGMRLWKQPIILTCKAYSGMGFVNVAVSYTFRVANASSVVAVDEDGEDAEEYEDEYGDKYAKLDKDNRIPLNSVDDFDVIYRIGFNPPSSVYYPTTLSVGANIQCTAYGIDYPTYKWYDSHWNTVSFSREVYVTEEMRHWKQPIALRCQAKSTSWPYLEVDDIYTFRVANAYSGPETTEAWVIAVAVIVPVVGLAAIAIAVFFIIRRREKKKLSTTNTKPTNGSTAALLLQY